MRVSLSSWFICSRLIHSFNWIERRWEWISGQTGFVTWWWWLFQTILCRWCEIQPHISGWLGVRGWRREAEMLNKIEGEMRTGKLFYSIIPVIIVINVLATITSSSSSSSPLLFAFSPCLLRQHAKQFLSLWIRARLVWLLAVLSLHMSDKYLSTAIIREEGDIFWESGYDGWHEIQFREQVERESWMQWGQFWNGPFGGYIDLLWATAPPSSSPPLLGAGHEMVRL